MMFHSRKRARLNNNNRKILKCSSDTEVDSPVWTNDERCEKNYKVKIIIIIKKIKRFSQLFNLNQICLCFF